MLEKILNPKFNFFFFEDLQEIVCLISQKKFVNNFQKSFKQKVF